MKPAFRWAAAAAFAAFIFILSSLPHLPVESPDIPQIDKAAHAVLYFLFAGTLWWALRGSGVKAAALAAVLAAAAYGATDEVHQYFVPGRTMSFFDWTADVIGACLWPLAAALAARKRATPRPRRPKA
jgi:VanZ family protein